MELSEKSSFQYAYCQLPELKSRIAQPEPGDTAIVEHVVSRFQLLAENGGQHTEHVFTSLAKFKNQFDGCFL